MADMQPSPTTTATGQPAVPLSVVGQPGGVAQLDSTGVVPDAQVEPAVARVVVHGAVAGTARPATATFVHWIGSVAPTNVATNDEWTDTANKITKRWNGASFDTLGSAASGVPVGGTTGQVLKKNSAVDLDTGWGDTAQLSNATPLISAGAGTPGTGVAASRNDHVHPAPAGLAAGLPINFYVAVATARNASNPFTLNTEYCWAYILPGSGTIDSLSIECTTLGDAGSVLRWGVRQDNAGLPGATVVAQGTVTATTTGYKTVTGLSIPYGATNSGILWISLAWQGGTATSPQVEACDKGGGFSAGPLAAALASPGGAQGHVLNIATTTGITGAFTTAVPAPPGTTQWNGDTPHIWLRRSA